MAIKVSKRDFIDAMTKAFQQEDFYGSQITRDYVEKRVNDLIGGAQPSSGPDMFIRAKLSEYEVSDE